METSLITFLMLAVVVLGVYYLSPFDLKVEDDEE
ncbi:hypothetical protein SAMN06265350_104220 [Solitalea koreensis]|uniref:Uncharacterized protein n=1 Tax=Solitalea koreensis TaxID=543615 RepID=A0A521CMS4_9SPHI|nr:hypothetical protein SAMN06265350_104220 [Solitalea koreensis]